MNLPYNIILISHEDSTKDITKKSGDKITSIKPNINDKTANKVAGMVDIVARAIVEDDGNRYLSFKSNEVIFGGGRLQGIKATEIPLSWEELMKVYDSVGIKSVKVQEPVKVVEPTESAEPTPVPIVEENVIATTQAEEPVRRTRRVRE